MEEALIVRLLASTDLATLVGGRVNWDERPQAEKLPALTLEGISDGTTYLHSGPDNLKRPRVQFDCWGRTPLEARQVSRAVFAEMSRLPNDIVVIGGVRFIAAFLENEGTSGPTTVNGVQIYSVQSDYVIWHEPA